MRRITDHRLDPGGFDDSLQGLVRSSPWWTLSLAVHGLAALILWHTPFLTQRVSAAVFVEAPPPDPPKPPVEDPPPPDLPEPPDERAEVDPIEVEDDPPAQDDLDIDDDATMGEEGDHSGPFEGIGENPDIGLGGGATGGPPGPGGRKRGRARLRTEITGITVELALKWLADHQDVDGQGMWDCDEFMKHDPADDKCDGPGKALYDPGVSGLALLAFLGAGYTDRGTKRDNPYAKNVRMGLRYLQTIQDDEGCFGPRQSQHFVYNHAIAALAMSEAWAMTRNPRYKKAAQDALNFISTARNPYLAWRYGVRPGDNDSSVTGWMVMALKSGKFGGLDIDPDAFEGARAWIDKMTDPDFGLTGYLQAGGPSARPEGLQNKFPAEKSQSMTAVGILTRIFLGENPRESKMIRKGAERCLLIPPVWNPDDGSIDMYYWYYATLALYQVGGTTWKRWNRAMVDAVVKSQHPRGSGSRTGSWDPIGPWGPDGGRVYSTATLAMCLEVYYRYDRVFGLR
ncbi:MAG: prenyltransferase/squalene oxidase repeat-containing protein [Planctomycetota bacterium]